MNPELEAAKKLIHDACVAFVRAAFKATGSAQLAVFMLAQEIGHVGNSFTDDDFADIEKEVS